MRRLFTRTLHGPPTVGLAGIKTRAASILEAILSLHMISLSPGSSQHSNPQVLESHTRPVLSLAIAGGRLFSGSYDYTIRVWNLETLQREKTLTGHTDAVRSLTVAGNKVFSASYDGKLKVGGGQGLGGGRGAPGSRGAAGHSLGQAGRPRGISWQAESKQATFACSLLPPELICSGAVAVGRLAVHARS